MLRFVHQLIRTLTLPNNAGASSPRLVLGPDIPAVLQAYYAPDVLFACFLAYSDANNYEFTTWGTVGGGALTDVFTGFVVAGVVHEIQTYTFTTGGSGTRTIDIGNFIAADTSKLNVDVNGAAGSQFNLFNTVDFIIDSTSQGRGLLDITEDTTTTGFIGPGETAVQFSNTVTFRNGRAFEVFFSNDTDSNVNGNFASFLLRRNNIAGTVLRFGWGTTLPPVGFGATCQGTAILINSSGSDITDNLLLTASSSLASIRLNGTGVGSANNRPRMLWIRDCGAAADFPAGQQI
jgi:hypothetical protein